MRVSVYTRQHGTRKLLKAKSETYPPQTIFVLRYGTVWETLPSGTDFTTARIERNNQGNRPAFWDGHFAFFGTTRT